MSKYDANLVSSEQGGVPTYHISMPDQRTVKKMIRMIERCKRRSWQGKVQFDLELMRPLAREDDYRSVSITLQDDAAVKEKLEACFKLQGQDWKVTNLELRLLERVVPKRHVPHDVVKATFVV